METSRPTSSLSGIRRQRASYSCCSCRARRVKCDQVHPKCGNCFKNDTPCVYRSAAPKRNHTTSNSVSSQSSTPAEPKTSRTGRKLGYLSLQNGGRSRFIENTFWGCIDAEDLELDSLLSDLPLFPSESLGGSAGASWAYRTTTFNARSVHSFRDVLITMPPKRTCDYLYRIFLSSIHSLMPLVYLPSFEKHYERFWTWHQNWNKIDIPEGVVAENPNFLPLLLAILFSGSVAGCAMASGWNQNSEIFRALQSKLYNLASNALSLVGFPQSPAIYSFVAFILLETLQIREEESLSSCSFIAVAFRISQAMGIHKDGTEFRLDPISIEERRRIWGHLMHLDVITSIMSGLPLVASSEAFCTTQMIGEVKDEFIGNQPDTTNVERPLVYLDPGYVLTVGRYEATALLREILLNQYGPEPLKNGDITALRGKIALFRRKIEERIRRLLLISESQHRIDCATPPSPSDVPQPDTSAFRRWAEESLHLMIEKAYCLLYQPLTQDRTLWAAMRQEALPHFQEFLGIFVRMCDNQYRPFHWLYPGAYQPLQSSAALLIDLLKYPITEESWKSRAVLESVFALLGSQDRIAASFETLSPTQRSPSVGARHAWARLEKVRRKAWTKLGLDSTVQWDRRAGPTHSSPSLKNNTSRSPVVENPAQMIPSWVFEDVGIETEMTTMGDAQDAIFQNLDSGLCNAPNPPISDPYQFPGSACSTDATMTSADYITSINSTLAYEHDANFANFVDSTRSVDVSLIDDIANQAFDHFLVPELGQEIDWNLEQEE